MSGVTILHCETDVVPECSVVFGAGRLMENGQTDSRVVEIVFQRAYFVRTGAHEDWLSVDSLGYVIEGVPREYSEESYERRTDQWRSTGLCPNSGFYVAVDSDWLPEVPQKYRQNSRHYVVDGRDGYVEVIAQGFAWKEWGWEVDHRDDVMRKTPVLDSGSGVE